MSFLRNAVKATCLAFVGTMLTCIPQVTAQEVELKASLFTPPSNPLVKGMQKWADELKQKSNGRLVIKIFPASQMGPAPRQFDLARTGVADISVFLHGLTPRPISTDRTIARAGGS